MFKTKNIYAVLGLKFVVFVILLFQLAACSGLPLPPDKSDYAGKWSSVEMNLTITSDGYVEYKRIGNGGTRSVSAPIKEFKGNDFVVGALGIYTTFVVSVPPHQVEGKWKMVVDGVELTRVVF